MQSLRNLFSIFSSVNQIGKGVLTRYTQPLVSSINQQQTRGFKHKDVLTLRCSDCYYRKIDERWHVLCKTYQRHKQVERIDDIRKKWIVTHRTIGGKPFMKREEVYVLGLAPPGPFDYKPKLGQKLRTRRKYLHPTMIPLKTKEARKTIPNIN